MYNGTSFAVIFFESLASQGLEKIILRNVLLAVLPVLIVFTAVGPWEVLAVNTGNGYHLSKKTSMVAPWGCCRRVRQWPPPKLKKMSMARPLGVLSESLTAATTKDGEDVDDRPPGVAAGGSGSGHHQI
jgi:hypothetical protein